MSGNIGAIMLDYVHFYLLYVFKKLEVKQILWKYLVIVVSIASCFVVVYPLLNVYLVVNSIVTQRRTRIEGPIWFNGGKM